VGPNGLRALFCMSLFIAFPMFLLPPAWAEEEELEVPFAGDEEWATDFATAQLSQVGSGKTILLLVWTRRDERVERLERDLQRWQGVPELLDSFCKVHLQTESNRSLVSELGVTRTPCLVLVGSDISRRTGDRVTGILDETGESEAVVSFQRRGLALDLSSTAILDSGSASQDSNLEAIDRAERAEKGGDPFESLRLLEELNDSIPSSSPEIKRKVLVKLADLSYGVGDLKRAGFHYRRAAVDLVESDTGTEALHVLYQLALLLNDAGQNREAGRTIKKRIDRETDPEEKQRLERIRDGIAGGLFVLAEMGYPGVGARLGGGGASPPEDLGDSSLSFEERVEKAGSDLEKMKDSLERWFRQTGKYPDYLEDLPAADLPEGGLPEDPFLEGSPYRYLHFEEPEDFLLYSIGPDGEDQFGDSECKPSEGEKGKGDIVRRP
jgi:tetratricopeptide (TPR) repeat protein